MCVSLTFDYKFGGCVPPIPGGGTSICVIRLGQGTDPISRERGNAEAEVEIAWVALSFRHNRVHVRPFEVQIQLCSDVVCLMDRLQGMRVADSGLRIPLVRETGGSSFPL